MQEPWHVLPPGNSDELCAIVSDVWDEVASSTRYIRSLIESMTRRMKSVFEAEGFRTISENLPFKGRSINFNFLHVGAIRRRSHRPECLRPLSC